MTSTVSPSAPRLSAITTSCEAFAQREPPPTRLVRIGVGNGPEMGKIGRRSVTDERSPDICNLLVGHHARCVFARTR
jgi:hypothetical protein